MVFQTPPLEAPTKTVLPDGSDGSTATTLTGPASSRRHRGVGRIPAGPTAVHVLLESGSVGAMLKIRNADGLLVGDRLAQAGAGLRPLEGQRPASSASR